MSGKDGSTKYDWSIVISEYKPLTGRYEQLKAILKNITGAYIEILD